MLNKLSFLFMGNLLSLVIPLIAIPFLTRMYNPEMFGEFAVLLVSSLLIGGIVTLKLENAILVERNRRQLGKLVNSITLLVIFISLFLVVFLSSLYLIFNNLLTFKLALGVVLASMCTGLLSVLNSLSVRFSYLNRLVISRLLVASLVPVAQLLYPWEEGLLYGYLIGLFLSLLMLMYIFKGEIKRFYKVALFDKSVVFKHIDFIKFTLPSSFLNNFVRYGPIFFISTFFGSMYAGFFQLSSKLVAAPVSLISTVYGDYLRSEISRDLSKFIYIKKVIRITLIMLVLASIFSYTILNIAVDNWLVLFLGDDWFGTQDTLSVLLVVMAFQIVGNPMSSILLLYNFQKVDFLLQILMLLLLLVPFALDLNYIDYIRYYAFVMIAIYLCFISVALFIIYIKNKREVV